MALGSIIGAAVGIGSSLLNSKGQKQAVDAQLEAARLNNETAQQINDDNIAFQEALNEQIRAQYEKLLGISLEGTVDAQGNRTRYIDGQGFVTSLSPEQLAIQSAGNNESLLSLTQDAAQAREGRNRTAALRTNEASGADAFLRQLLEPNPYNVSTIESAFAARGRRGVNEAFDRTADRLGTQALRSGSTNTDALSSLATKRSEALRDADVDAFLQALSSAEDLNAQRLSSLGGTQSRLSSAATTPVGQRLVSLPTPQTSNGNAGQLSQLGFLNASQRAPSNTTIPQLDPAIVGNAAGLGSMNAGNMLANVGNLVSSFDLSSLFKNSSQTAALPWRTNTNTGVF